MSPKSGFKTYEDCHRMISVTDPHRVCLWCLEHNPKSCSECWAMHPKALRERSLKLMAAQHSTPFKSQSRSRGRSRDQSRSHHHSSSKLSGHGKKKKSSKKSHRSPTSPRRSADATQDEHQRSRPLSSELMPGSDPRFPEYPGAPAQLRVLQGHAPHLGVPVAVGFASNSEGLLPPFRIRTTTHATILPSPLEDHLVLLRQEVAALLAKGAIERVPVPEVGCGCYSHYFLIPKKEKGLLHILDLRDLKYFLKKKFKMLTLAQVLSALDSEDWMVVLDLQDAYFHIHIPILPAHRRYLRFVVGHEHFQFTVLPFRLTSAPRVFTEVMVMVAAHLRRLGVSGFPYVGDWLLKAPSHQTVLSHLQTTANLLHQQGFTFNVPKSHLTPSQMLPFIGAVLDTVQFRVYPPQKRAQDIQAMIPIFQPSSWVS
ncbi:hypothetical protein NDU88_005364 [Pleurodeles waltl]|uniref:ribonuclease H n=1 Tax=Pleurodeles waltl TaxID=8319 RepID=A0AAV7QIL9_PLEWA|nr:hypothetical protein NDU88_005364 [Pleurodeles waltl]